MSAGDTDAWGISREFDRALNVIDSMTPKGVAAAMLPWVKALLDEAAEYARDWAKSTAKNRGPTPQTIYKSELGLARATNGRVS